MAFLLLLRNQKFKKLYDQFNVHHSIQSKVVLASITSRFTNGFSTLLNSSISIVDALTIMSKLLGNRYVEGGYSLEKCGKIGSLLSKDVIQVVGTELQAAQWEKIKEEILLIN